jgi:hypothetical protein
MPSAANALSYFYDLVQHDLVAQEGNSRALSRGDALLLQFVFVIKYGEFVKANLRTQVTRLFGKGQSPKQFKNHSMLTL